MSDAAASAPSTAAPAAGEQASEGAKEGQQQPPQPRPTKAPNYRKFKVGEEEVALSDDDIKRDYQKWKSADQRFREASQKEQALQKFWEDLQNDPEKVLNDKRLPLDRRRLAMKWLEDQVTEDLTPKDPRDKKLSEAEQRLKEYEEREAAAEQEKQTAEYQKGLQESRDRIGNTIREVGKMTQLSADPESEAALVREVAMYMRTARENDAEVTPEQIVEHIHNQRFRQFYSLANRMSGEDLIEFLGEHVVRNLRQADLARIKKAREGGGATQSHKQATEAGWGKQSAAPKRMDTQTARDLARRSLK